MNYYCQCCDRCGSPGCCTDHRHYACSLCGGKGYYLDDPGPVKCNGSCAAQDYERTAFLNELTSEAQRLGMYPVVTATREELREKYPVPLFAGAVSDGMSRRPKKKHREHTRKPLTDARKQELFAQIIREAAADAGKSTLVAPDDEDLKVIESDAQDLEYEAAAVVARPRSIWTRLLSWVPFRGERG